MQEKNAAALLALWLQRLLSYGKAYWGLHGQQYTRVIG